jgi:hypothetical protein
MFIPSGILEPWIIFMIESCLPFTVLSYWLFKAVQSFFLKSLIFWKSKIEIAVTAHKRTISVDQEFLIIRYSRLVSWCRFFLCVLRWIQTERYPPIVCRISDALFWIVFVITLCELFSSSRQRFLFLKVVVLIRLGIFLAYLGVY